MEEEFHFREVVPVGEQDKLEMSFLSTKRKKSSSSCSAIALPERVAAGVFGFEAAAALYLTKMYFM